MRHPLLAELERHVVAKLDKIGEPHGGCIVLLAVELASANAALEGVGVAGAIQIGDHAVEIGGDNKR